MKEIKFMLFKDGKHVGWEWHVRKHNKRTKSDCYFIDYYDTNDKWKVGILHDAKYQYTGKKDRNGKEIYERHRVEYKYEEYTVYFNKDTAGYYIVNNLFRTEDVWHGEIMEYTEIIGHIEEEK